MARQTTVTLGGRPYVVQALPIRETAAWRRRLQTPVDEITLALGALGETRPDAEGKTELDIGGLLGVLGDTLIGSMELLLDLLCAYAPAIAADRARIEADGFDEEVVKAFMGVLGLVYPFGELARSVSGGIKTPRPTPRN